MEKINLNCLESKLTALRDKQKAVYVDADELLKDVVQAFFEKYGTREVKFNVCEAEAPCNIYYTNRHGVSTGVIREAVFNEDGEIISFVFSDYEYDESDTEGLTYNSGEVAEYIIAQLKNGQYNGDDDE